MPSILRTALTYMNRTSRDTVFQTDLIKHVSNRTGSSFESVRGTIVGFSSKKLFSQASFEENWVVCRREKGKPARYVRKDVLSEEDTIYGIDYDTVQKREARERGLKYVSKRPGNYLTLAGTEGFCARYIWEKCPTATIYNVERERKDLIQWQQKRMPTGDFFGELSDFIRTPFFAHTKFQLLNLDMMGYPCDYLNDDFKLLNSLKNSAYIVITLSGIRRFRNGGEFVTKARAKYTGADPTQEWIKDTFKNYLLIDEWFYRRDLVVDCRDMRMFVLKRTA